MRFRSESNWNWLPVFGLPILVPLFLCFDNYTLGLKLPAMVGYVFVSLGAVVGATFLLRMFGRRYWPLVLAYAIAFFPVTLLLGLWFAAAIWKDAL